MSTDDYLIDNGLTPYSPITELEAEIERLKSLSGGELVEMEIQRLQSYLESHPDRVAD